MVPYFRIAQNGFIAPLQKYNLHRVLKGTAPVLVSLTLRFIKQIRRLIYMRLLRIEELSMSQMTLPAGGRCR